MDWIWIVCIGALVMLVVDWLIVMGFDPRKWRGGGKNDKS